MKRVLCLILILFLFSACERNFDELNDTEQRSVTFSFNTDGFFDEVLVFEDGVCSLGDYSGMDEQHRIRVNGYCYDGKGELVGQETLFAKLGEKSELKFKHLYQDLEYQFIFLADVVQFRSVDDYYETWYQLKIRRKEQFYLASFELEVPAKYNVVKRKIMNAKPSNQTLEVDMEPVTYNGYVEFVNLNSNVQKVCAYTGTYQSLYVTSLQGIIFKGKYYENADPHQIATIVPITATMADNEVLIDARLYRPSATDSTIQSISTTNHRRFFATFDCQTMNITSCCYY